MAEDKETVFSGQGFVEGLSELIKERFTNAFSLSFLFSWIVVNYRLFVVIFGEGEYAPKLEYIQNVLYKDGRYEFYNWVNCLLLPLLSATFFCFVWPFAATEIKRFRVMVRNREEVRILVQRRLKPVDPEKQKLFFDQFDKENERLRREIDSIGRRQIDERTYYTDAFKVQDEAIRRLRRKMIATRCGLNVEELNVLINEDSYVSEYTDRFKEINERVADRSFFVNVVKLVDFATGQARMSGGRSIVTKGQLAGILNIDLADEEDVFEEMAACDILERVTRSSSSEYKLRLGFDADFIKYKNLARLGV